MKHFTFFLVAFAAIAGLVAFVAPAPGHGDEGAAPNFVTKMKQASSTVWVPSWATT
jgi:hypothetical protein